jgi:transcriptional regulator with XRE-family HTH domain
VGRHRLRYHWLWNSGRQVKSTSYGEIDTLNRWELFYRTPYSEMVGARTRRARTNRGLTQGALVGKIERPQGGYYSRGLLSRIEKGSANSPLYLYMHIADALELEPGRLMGSDEAQKPISEAEMTLVRFLRRTGIHVDEALALLAGRDAPRTGGRA